jgi:uncharacterized protein (TIGR00255 family)
MSMKSMTGFGSRDFQDSSIHLMVEIKCYNNRYLDLVVSLPPPLNPLEGKIRKLLTDRIGRGRVEFSLRMRELEENITVHIDTAVAEQYYRSLKQLADRLGLEGAVTLSHLLDRDGVIKTDKSRDMDHYWTLLEPVLSGTVADLEQDRIREGAATETDILKSLSVIEEQVAEIERFAPEIEKTIRENFVAKFREVTGSEIDENRLLTEMGLYLIRYDINEELSRLRAHTKAFRDDLRLAEPVGRKLDFLAQEMNREINTIGSKSGFLPISRAVVLVKESLEKIREQVRNVE